MWKSVNWSYRSAENPEKLTNKRAKNKFLSIISSIRPVNPTVVIPSKVGKNGVLANIINFDKFDVGTFASFSIKGVDNIHTFIQESYNN